MYYIGVRTTNQPYTKTMHTNFFQEITMGRTKRQKMYLKLSIMCGIVALISIITLGVSIIIGLTQISNV